MTERWPGYNQGDPPPGARAYLIKRGGKSWAPWHLEVSWDGLAAPIDLGTVSDYFNAGVNWVELLQWASIADDEDPLE